MNHQNDHVWLEQQDSWLYMDMLGITRGRVDKVAGRSGAPSYWWQTAHVMDCEPNLYVAKRLVEREIRKQ